MRSSQSNGQYIFHYKQLQRQVYAHEQSFSYYRIPFTLGGTAYSKYLAVDLARFALKGLIDKTALDPKTVDYLFYGTVIQEPKTSNIAREAAMVDMHL